MGVHACINICRVMSAYVELNSFSQTLACMYRRVSKWNAGGLGARECGCVCVVVQHNMGYNNYHR